MKVSTVVATTAVVAGAGIGVAIYVRKRRQWQIQENRKSEELAGKPAGDWVDGLVTNGDFDRPYQYRVNLDPKLRRYSFKVGETEIDHETLEAGEAWVKGLPPRNWRNRTSK